MICGKTTLGEFLSEYQADRPEIHGSISVVLLALANGVKKVAARLSTTGLEDFSVLTPEVNPSGQRVQKIDKWANDTFVDILIETREVTHVYSEEMKVPVVGTPKARNLVCLDPLDGSHNLAFNITTGSIFSIYQRPGSFYFDSCAENFLNLRDQVCAGYCLYGPATILVIAFEDSTYEFVLVKDLIGGPNFVLAVRDIKLLREGDSARIYSINEAYSLNWPEELRLFINDLKSQSYSLRYVGSLVADFHRTLKAGGIFINPTEKLRLYFEAGPMAFIIKAAGGLAINCYRPPRDILDVKGRDAHAKTPLALGPSFEVAVLSGLLR